MFVPNTELSGIVLKETVYSILVKGRPLIPPLTSKSLHIENTFRNCLLCCLLNGMAIASGEQQKVRKNTSVYRGQLFTWYYAFSYMWQFNAPISSVW